MTNSFGIVIPSRIRLFLLPHNIEIDVTIQYMRMTSPWDPDIAYSLIDQGTPHGIKVYQEFVTSRFNLIIFDANILNYFNLTLARDSKLHIGSRN